VGKSGKGKPCGASYIAANKNCRIGLSAVARRALDAASHEIGRLDLYHAVRAHAGVAEGARKMAPAGVMQKFDRIANEVREKYGKNIGKAERAEFRRRLIAEGLLPGPKKEASEKTKDAVPDPKKGTLEKAQEAVEEHNKKAQSALNAKNDEAFGRHMNNLILAQAELELALLRDERKRLEGKLGGSSDGEAINWMNKLDAKIDVANEKVKMAKKGVVKTAKPVVQPQFGLKTADDNLEAKELKRSGDPLFDKWRETSRDAGSKNIGRGSFGTVHHNKGSNLAVKRGDISTSEVEILKKLGDKGIVPKLIAADINGPGQQDLGRLGIDNRWGRVAMEFVAGKPLGDMVESHENINKFWEARAALHREGIAHNDMHPGNVIIQDNGKAKFVDLGLAQDSPKAALSEAMGAFIPPRVVITRKIAGAKNDGDWQVIRWDATGGPKLRERNFDYKNEASSLSRLMDNKNALQYRMMHDGFTKEDIALIMKTGIRNRPDVYERDVWAKISDERAKEYLNILYEGI